MDTDLGRGRGARIGVPRVEADGASGAVGAVLWKCCTAASFPVVEGGWTNDT